jgi:hypothetical protein
MAGWGKDGGMRVYPVKFEAYDESNEPAFKVEGFDESCATVTVSYPVNVESWDEISADIRQCLVDMRLGDEAMKAKS